MKAAAIIATTPELNDKLFARLRGFHTVMSYMGAIGYIMGGSGLEELWEEVYAPNSVKNMLTGHAYSRALRGHLLASTSVTTVILKSMDENSVNTENVSEAAEILMNSDEVRQVEDYPVFSQIAAQINQARTEDDDDSRTLILKYWKQYKRMVLILCLFLYSERSGNMPLQEYCLTQMVPVLHSSGHMPYAKCVRLYLQQLHDLKQKLDCKTYNDFVNGLFTVEGNFTDQTIETDLMRLIKTKGGLIHGRGITDSTMAQFVHALPHCIPICDYLEKITGVYATTSEQHKDLRPTSQTRDKSDLEKLNDWLYAHSPCDYGNSQGIVALSTGEVGSQQINCERAYDISHAAAEAIVGQNFPSIKLSIKDKVVTFNSQKHRMQVRGRDVEINPGMLFHRMTCVLTNNADLEGYLKYELSQYPPALFKNGLLRKNTKSEMTNSMKEDIIVLETLPVIINLFIIDGGYLLHKYVWDGDFTYEKICLAYIQYIHNHLSKLAIIVFDGYNSNRSTKEAEQRRRASKNNSPDILFDANMKPTVSQENFLKNPRNKSRLITMLRNYCQEAGIETLQAVADADYLIISTAIQKEESTDHGVVVVGNDSDLVAIVTATAKANTRICIMTETDPATIYLINDFQTKFTNEQRKHLVTMHYLTGYDTTSACYLKGKKTGIKVLKSLTGDELTSHDTFLTGFTDGNIQQKKEEIVGAGEMFLLKLYGSKSATTLDRLRYLNYNQKLKNAKITSEFLLESLPPTSAATKQHSLRVYHAVQQSLGVYINPLDCGWAADGDALKPVYTDVEVAPPRLLKMISCGCKTGCTRGCGCVKLGIYCSVMCSNCNGQSCQNVNVDLTEEEG